jgi:NAD(P)-dependent dehydrogenase (short-subunit alcohol dehydrogenase family)
VSVVLITGASGGVGRALARLLHSQGKRVAAVGRDADRLRDVDAEVRIACDVTTLDGAQHAVTACREAFGAAPQLLVSRMGGEVAGEFRFSKLSGLIAVRFRNSNRRTVWAAR